MAQQSDSGEDEENRQRLADRVLGVLQDAVYWAIAAVLFVGCAALIVAQFHTMTRLRNAPVETTMLQILDGLLLIFIFVELLYAVRACLRSHEIVAEPFLIVGILAGIKELVVLSLEAAALLEKGPAFARAVVEIGVLAGVVLALAQSASCSASAAGIRRVRGKTRKKKTSPTGRPNPRASSRPGVPELCMPSYIAWSAPGSGWSYPLLS